MRSTVNLDGTTLSPAEVERIATNNADKTKTNKTNR